MLLKLHTAVLSFIICNDLSQVFDCFQLNTPPPIMSACLAPPNRPDPFRSGPHPTRDLGDPTWRMHTIHLQVQPRWAVLQLSQEEDQAITNLLKLHHQMDDGPFLGHPGAQEGHEPARGVLGEGRVWSDAELEAADTLLSQFKMKDSDLLKTPNQSCRAHQEPEPLPELGTSDQNRTSLNWAGENGDVWPVEDRSAGLDKGLPLKMSPEIQSPSVFGGFSEEKEQTSNLEGDAVRVLLSLIDVDIVQ